MIMCKIDDFIDVTSRYIAELLDLRADIRPVEKDVLHTCLLYTSDAADE